MTPSYIVIVCKINKKISFNCYKNMKKIVFYNIKKICVKQITQISFNLLFITGVCL